MRLPAAAILLLLASGGAAQAPAGGLVVDIGLVHRGQSDRAASPLHYTGIAPTLGLSYGGGGLGGRLEVGAVFAVGSLSSAITTDGLPQEDVWVGRLGLRYLRRIARAWDRRLTLFAGGQLAAHGSFRQHRYTQDGDESFADLLVPLQVVGGWEWSAGAVRAGQRLAIPVLGLVMRTPYGGLKYTPPLDLSLPGQLVGLDHELFVERNAIRRLAVRGSWSFLMLRHPEPRELRLVEHRLTVGVVLRPGAPR
jgi:hypothetical protein